MTSTSGTTLLERPVVEEPLSQPLPDGSLPRPKPKRPRFLGEGFIVYVLALGAYLAIADLLFLVYHTYQLDAASRLANAFYVLYSGDPHLAAIGFVWNPLPSVLEMPLLLVHSVWPVLTHRYFAAGICSAFEMAGAVYQLQAMLREWSVRRTARLTIVAIFALNPLIAFYGGNGMSEALYVFTLTMTARYLVRWMSRGDTRSLTYAGASLALAYLTRYESAGSAVAAGVLVFAVTYVSSSLSRRERFERAAMDFAIFILPVITSFVGWATISYIISGTAFEQLSGVYGNTEQLKVDPSYSPVHTTHARIVLEAKTLFLVAPTLAVLLVIALLIASYRHDFRVTAPIAVLGAALGFDLLSYMVGGIAYYLRFFIMAVPLMACLAGAIFVPGQTRAGTRPKADPETLQEQRRGMTEHISVQPKRRHRGQKAVLGLLAAVGATLMCLPAYATTIKAGQSPLYGTEVRQVLGPVFDKKQNSKDRAQTAEWPAVQQIDNYISRMHLADGQIVADTFAGCTPSLILQAAQPKVFVITSDRDFQRILANPIAFHVHYFLDPQPVTLDSLDAINRLYPSMYENGDGFAKLVHQFNTLDGACGTFRLYRITGIAPDA